MDNLRFSRRNLLQAAGLGAAANTFLPELRNRAYAAGEVPKMFLMFYSYHGTWKADWGSNAGGMTLGPLLQPLAPFKDDICLLSGLDSKTALLYPGNNLAGHIQGQVHSLTSTKPSMPVADVGSRPVAGGPSIDQEILEQLKAKNGGKQLTEIDSVQLGIADAGPGSDQMLGRAGYKRQGTVIRSMGYFNDPNLAYGTIFNGFTPGGATPAPSTSPGKEDPARLQRRLMAQFARGQFDSVSAKVNNLYGKDSQDRFKAHADYMSTLEKSLAPITDVGGNTITGGSSGGVISTACQVPDRSQVPNKPSGGWVDVLSDNMPKLAHLALACGRTRFVTVAIEATITQDPGLHGKVHARDMAGTRSYYVKIAEQVAKTIKLLKDSPTADGKNLLYHTTFLWAGELGDGGEHSFTDMQWVIGGQAGGGLQTGRFIDVKGKGTADLYVSLGKLMGADMTTFGDPMAYSGPIASIKA